MTGPTSTKFFPYRLTLIAMLCLALSLTILAENHSDELKQRILAQTNALSPPIEYCEPIMCLTERHTQI
jgi:hypothetical protein